MGVSNFVEKKSTHLIINDVFFQCLLLCTIMPAAEVRIKKRGEGFLNGKINLRHDL